MVQESSQTGSGTVCANTMPAADYVCDAGYLATSWLLAG
jgi:hypothetical protein